MSETENRGSTFVHGIEPGGLITDAFEIFNFTNEVARFDTYATDLTTTSRGGTTSSEEQQGGPASWISIEASSLEVPAHSSMLVEFTVNIPPGTAPDGYRAVLMIEPHTTQEIGNIITRTRVGLPIDIEVLGDVNIELGVGDLNYERHPSGYLFSVTVENTGDVTFEIAGEVSTNTSSGEHLVDISLETGGLFLAPGESATLDGLWEQPPFAGIVEARAEVQALVLDRLPRTALSNTVVIWIVPWTEILAAAAFIGLGVWVYLVASRRKRDWGRHRARERMTARHLVASRRAGTPTTEGTRSRASARHLH